MMFSSIYVCLHALTRWRERAISHASDSDEEVIESFRRSVAVEKREPLPFARRDGMRYYFNAAHGCYFVAQPIDIQTVRIVTVIMPTCGRTQPILVPKKRAKHGNPPEQN